MGVGEEWAVVRRGRALDIAEGVCGWSEEPRNWRILSPPLQWQRRQYMHLESAMPRMGNSASQWPQGG